MKRWTLSVAATAALCAGALAASGENLTLTTYYPSPRGVYDELRANRLILNDQATGKSYGLTVSNGRFLLTDTEKQQAYLLLELPDAKRER